MNKSKERKQFLMDVFTTAIEGGINGWAAVSQYQWRKPDGSDDLDGFFATVHELNDDESDYREVGLCVNADTIAAGIGKITRGECNVHQDYVSRIREASVENDAGDIDAYDASMIVQAGMLGEVIYG